MKTPIRRFLRAALAASALALAAAVTLHAPLEGQEPRAPGSVAVSDTIYEIRLTDGSSLFGRVVAVEGNALVVETSAGARITLDPAQIRRMWPVRGRLVNGEMWLEDPHATRLFFGPTARAVPQGEGYFGVYELFFPFVTYGVTDRFTISGGTPVAPNIIGEAFYLAPKLEVLRSPTASAAVGVLAVFATRQLDGTVGLLYGVGTFGTSDQAVTVGATVPFVASTDQSEIGREPAVMLGGEARLTRRSKFITENYFVPTETFGLLSGGVRFFGERLSADFGLGFAFGDGDLACCLPLVNFVYSFGGRQ